MENVAYVFRLYPTREQMVFFAKSFGCMRNYWNLALAEYQQTKFLVGPAKFKSAYPYLKEVDSLGLANVWKDLKQALQRHFANPKHFGMPRFKIKKCCKDSYTTNNQHGTVSLTKKYIRLPKVGLVRCKVHRTIPDTYTLKSATISCNKAGQFLCMLEYKCKQKGKVFVKVDKWYPSSQLCGNCGYKNPVVKSLRVRSWECPVCGVLHDRDVNAARNIQQEGLRLYLANI